MIKPAFQATSVARERKRKFPRQIVLAALGALLIASLVPARAESAPAIYSVAKIAATATAKDAVTAKQEALADAQAHALDILLRRLTGFAVHNRLPHLDPSQVDEMIDGVAVRDERYSSTQYLATLDINFEPKKVRRLLNQFGLPYVDEQAPSVTIAPLLAAPGGETGPGNGDMQGGAPAARTAQGMQRGWHRAWGGLDLAHALAPVKLAARGSSVALSGQLDAAALRGALERIKYQVQARHVVLAVAQIDSGQRLNVLLSGDDARGPFTLRLGFKVYDGDSAAALGQAARVAFGVLQERWKMMQLASTGALEGPAELQPVDLTVAVSNLGDWRKLRKEIAQIPGVQDFMTKGLFAGGARVSLSFPGGPERLQKAVATRGLTLEQRGGVWVLRRR